MLHLTLWCPLLLYSMCSIDIKLLFVCLWFTKRPYYRVHWLTRLPVAVSIRRRHSSLWLLSTGTEFATSTPSVCLSGWRRRLDALKPVAVKHCKDGGHLGVSSRREHQIPQTSLTVGSDSSPSARCPGSWDLPGLRSADEDTLCKDCVKLLCGIAADPERQTVCVKTGYADTGRVTCPEQTRLWLRHIGRTSGQPTRQAAVRTECSGATHLWSMKIRPRDAAASWAALAASARTHYLPAGDTCVSLSAQHGAVQLYRASSVACRQRLRSASNSLFHALYTQQSATEHSVWPQLGRGTPWHRPCSPLSQFFDVAWRLNCSHSPSEIDYICVCLRASWLSLQPWSH